MYRISVLILCFLGAATFGNETATYDDSTTTTTISPSNVPCHSPADCNWLPGMHTCINATCYDCYDCCANKRENCPRRRCYCTWFLTDEELKIVAQAVLGVAVFVTCVALVSLLWKVCTRRLRRRRAVAAGADLLDDTTSLSSQQVFVVERLRDRPPRYEEAARDFAVEKPPPYSEVVSQVEEAGQRRTQTALVAGVPVTLVGRDLTARDFAAPPPYSPPPTRSATLLPPTVPCTPPVQRLRRVVRKVVVIRRLGRWHTTAPDADDDGSRPKRTPPQCPESVSPTAASASGGPLAVSEHAAVGRDDSQTEPGAGSTAASGATVGEGSTPGSPTSTKA